MTQEQRGRFMYVGGHNVKYACYIMKGIEGWAHLPTTLVEENK